MLMVNKITSNQQGHALLFGFLAIVLVAVIGFAGWRVMNKKSTSTPASVTSSVTSNSQPTLTAPLTAGTDNVSLSSDLTNVDSVLGQSAQDNTAVNSGLNDQQSQVSVPTN